MNEALVDLTGGVSEKFHFRAPETAESIEGGQFWKDLKRYHQQGFLLGCANTVKDENGNPAWFIEDEENPGQFLQISEE